MSDDTVTVVFAEKPLEAIPERGLCIIARGESGWGWQMRFYDQISTKFPLKLRLGTVPHEVEAWEIVENLQKVDVSKLVLTKETYEGVFKALFDAPTVRHQRVKKPYRHVFKPDGSLNQ